MGTFYFVHHYDYRSCHSWTVIVESKCPEDQRTKAFLGAINTGYKYEAHCHMAIATDKVTGKAQTVSIAKYVEGQIFEAKLLHPMLAGELSFTLENNIQLTLFRQQYMNPEEEWLHKRTDWTSYLMREDVSDESKAKHCKDIRCPDWEQYYLGRHYASING